MNKLKFFICDVFGNEKYSGNQLGVFINCENLSSEEMQKIARELNFSETTFITSNKKENGGYDVRIFTPNAEVDFAGHPTLGTAFILYKYFENEQNDTVLLNLKVGQIPVSVKNGIFTMEQKQPVFGEPIDSSLAAKSLNISINEIDDKFPVQFVSTGLEFVFVPLKSLETLKKLKLNLEYHEQLINETQTKGVFVFCNEGREDDHDISSRMFAPFVGVTEDPATGSATGCLAAYLLKNNCFNKSEINLKVGQGHEINRPSELRINASLKNNYYQIKIGGKVIEVAEGFWNS